MNPLKWLIILEFFEKYNSRQEQTDGKERPNYLRQYYDVACLLRNSDVQQFIGTTEYNEHKKTRFPKKDLEIPVKENEAFLLTNAQLRKVFTTV